MPLIRALAIAALLAAGPVWADNATLAPAGASDSDTITLSSPLNWHGIIKCAHQDLGPEPPDYAPITHTPNDDELRKLNDANNQRMRYYELKMAVDTCTALLMARHEGWAAATDKPDPMEQKP